MDVLFCTQCGCQLDPLCRSILIEVDVNNLATSRYVCFLCYAMFTAADTPYFSKVQRDWQAREDSIKRLKPGANYLE